MAVLPTNIHISSSQFQENKKTNQAMLVELAEKQKLTREKGKKRWLGIAKLGKLKPRERLECLLDPGSYFLELSSLAALDMYNGEAPGASQITGIGLVSGVECMINVHDFTIKGGALYPMSVEKILRAQDIARENRLPCIYLVESAGANLLYQADFFAHLGGKTFANQTQMSAAGIPQVAIVFGSSTAGGAYIPGLSDYNIMVKEQAKVFLGGPPLVKMATGEEVGEEELGGAQMHASTSGVCDYLAENDHHAIEIAREIASSFQQPKYFHTTRKTELSPKYSTDEILGIIPPDPKIPFEVREIIARLVDGSQFNEFKPNYGSTLVCGYAHIGGFPIGIIANNGVLFSESALKGCQFIQLCNQSRIPLLYLQNITGFMVGKEYEQGGIVKHGAKMVNAVSNSNVPQFTIILRGSYGAGNYAMCGRAYNPRFLFAWPGSRIGVMGPEQAAGVLTLVQEQAAKKKNIEIDRDKLEATRQATIQKMEKEADCYYATARLWDDGIIDPQDTREVLRIGLSVACNQDYISMQPPNYGVFRM